MRRSFRSPRRLGAVGAAAGIAVLALVGTASAPAATHSVTSLTAAHKCLVMTGSGDPAFVKNFNPYTAGGGNLPDRHTAVGQLGHAEH